MRLSWAARPRPVTGIVNLPANGHLRTQSSPFGHSRAGGRLSPSFSKHLESGSSSRSDFSRVLLDPFTGGVLGEAVEVSVRYFRCDLIPTLCLRKLLEVRLGKCVAICSGTEEKLFVAFGLQPSESQVNQKVPPFLVLAKICLELND